MWIVATLDGKMESEGKDVVFPLVLTPSGGGGVVPWLSSEENSANHTDVSHLNMGSFSST